MTSGARAQREQLRQADLELPEGFIVRGKVAKYLSPELLLVEVRRGKNMMLHITQVRAPPEVWVCKCPRCNTRLPALCVRKARPAGRQRSTQRTARLGAAPGSDRRGRA